MNKIKILRWQTAPRGDFEQQRLFWSVANPILSRPKEAVIGRLALMNYLATNDPQYREE